MLTAMCLDKEGNAWVGSVEKGMYVMMRRDLSVTQWMDIPLQTGGTIRNDIHSLYFDSQSGGMWIGFFRQGLHRYNPHTHRVDIPYKELDSQICRVLYQDSHQRIWVGTFHNNLYCIDQGKVRSYSYPNTGYQGDPDFSNIRAIIEDGKGRLWISVYGGVGRLDPVSGEIALLSERHPELKKYKTANVLALDNEGCLMVGADNGLYIYHQETDQIWIPERDNTEYAVEELSRDVGMTRMNLYRKLQSITGHTPSDFIKSIRLKRAAQLLQGSQLTMAEVADRVGFSSASYFTKCFKEMFGVLPTQYVENHKMA